MNHIGNGNWVLYWEDDNALKDLVDCMTGYLELREEQLKRKGVKK